MFAHRDRDNVVFESGYDRGEVVDGHESLLSKQSVPDDIYRVLVVGRSHVLGERTVLRELDDGAGLPELGRAVLLGGLGDGRGLCCAGRRRACPLERRELNDGGVELVYLGLWIHERRLHGGIEQLLSLLALTGNESVLGEGCVRGASRADFDSRAGDFEGTVRFR